MESIYIHNFGGLNNVDISINSINIFIGRQASGKSIVVKLIYFFKSIFKDIFDGAQDGLKKKEIDAVVHRQFESLFPPEAWPESAFVVRYTTGIDSISIERIIGGKTRLKISYSGGINKLFAYSRRLIASAATATNDSRIFSMKQDNLYSVRKYHEYINANYGRYNGTLQVFVPAGRSFFANLQSSVFSFLSNNSRNIDPFLIRFGSFYEGVKSIVVRNRNLFQRSLLQDNDYAQNFEEFINELVRHILNSRYLREKNKDYLIHDDGRKINLAFSSSGQQEILPLLIILKSLTTIKFEGGGATLYIEEPEAHLFPSSQKIIVELIASIYNDDFNDNQFFITTHSPYIISTFNNLIQGGNMIDDGQDLDTIQRKVSQFGILKYDQISAYALADGKVTSLKDDDSKLLITDIIDEVSEELSEEFDNLLNVL